MKKRSFALIAYSLAVLLLISGCIADAPEFADVPRPNSIAEMEAEAAKLEEMTWQDLDFTPEKDAVVSQFKELCDISHVSGNESAMADNIAAWAEGVGLTAEKDAAGNVIIEKKASPGYEDRSEIMLQAHLDYLYFTSAEPVESPAPLVIDNEGVLSSDGSSFGASNGLGVACIMHILSSDWPSGKIKAIFTVGGDSELSGAQQLDSAVISGKYLISFDGLESHTIGYGHTGSRRYTFTSSPEWIEAPGDAAYTISVTGLSGGDSGIYAGEGRANAIRCVAECIEHIRSKNIDVYVAGASGGDEQQAIPRSASAVIVVDSAVAEDVELAAAEYQETLRSVYAETEPSHSFSCVKNDEVPAVVLSQNASMGLLNLLTLSVEGVNTMSSQTEGIVESSCTISNVSVDESSIVVRRYVRSYSDGRFDQIENADTTLASMCGFSMSLDLSLPGWTNDSSSTLLTNAVNLYGELIGDETKVGMYNTTMECGIFAEKNPGLDMIVLGADIDGVHSPAESADTSALTDVLILTYGLLQNIE